jgi:hypothetical protein
MTEDNETETTETPVVPFAPESLEQLADIIALVLDAKACGHRTRSLQEVNSAALKSLAEIAAKRSDFDQHATAKNAALDKREREIFEREVALNAKAGQLDERHVWLVDFGRNITERENALKRRVMLLAGETPPRSDGFQAMPSWEEIDGMLNPDRGDPHYMPAAEVSTESEPVPNGPTDRTPLMRAAPPASRSAAARRAERRAAEGHAA